MGHDWGASVAWYFCLFRPDRVKALVNLSVAYSPRRSHVKPLDFFRNVFRKDYYMVEFQVSANPKPFSFIPGIFNYFDNFAGTRKSGKIIHRIRNGVRDENVPLVRETRSASLGERADGFVRRASSSSFLAVGGRFPLLCRRVRENRVRRGIKLLPVS